MRIKHIDGIRAISVLSVLIFHAFPKQFPNGFLGVDYFLVISGFLISKKYFFDSSSKFEFIPFCKKRIKRLYPQLIVCISICIPIAFLTMQPDYLENFGQSVLATLFGINNILLYLTGGYWNLTNELKPLFNTWSLGIEEQFYLITSFTFFLSLNFGFKKLLKPIFIMATLISFFICSFGFIYYQKANYLLLTSRFWEFSIGIIAGSLKTLPESKFPSSLTNLSFLVILASLIFPFDTLKFSPNPFLILPLLCIGILCLEKRSLISIKLLSFKPLVYLGLASYSIYLYHQPIYAFARIKNFYRLDTNANIFLIFLSTIIGLIMYELIERKNYLPRFLINLFNSTKALLISIFSLVIFNLPIIIYGGLFELRFPGLMIDGKPPEGFLGGKKYTNRSFIYKDSSFDLGNKNTIKIVAYGNSQTRDFINVLIELGKIKNIKFDFVYSDEYRETLNNDFSSNKKLLDSSDFIIFQTNSESIPDQILIYKEKLIALRDRERFVYNINPIIFKSDLERKNFTVKNIENFSCTKVSLFQIRKNENKKFNAIINSKCAFIKNNKTKITSEEGEIYTFDGFHLSKAGAKEVALKLLSETNFYDYIFNFKTQKIK